MKKQVYIFLAGFSLLCWTACMPKSEHSNQKKENHLLAEAGYIPKDSANKMISSYLASLPVPPDSVSPALHSLIVSADLLRDYLNDTTIQSVKLMFAHTLDYINAGNQGVPAGYKSGALTLVFGGYDRAGNYAYGPGLTVPDHCKPCPEFCPEVGNAASSLLQ